MFNPEKWMQSAFELALQAAEKDEVPVGAILVCNDEIIGAGANARESKAKTVAHAEIQALEDYNQRVSSWRLPADSSLYVTVEPCLMCTGALLWARVTNIYFGCADTKDAGLRRVLPLVEDGTLDHRFSKIEGGVLEEQCSKLMSGYFASKRKGTPFVLARSEQSE